MVKNLLLSFLASGMFFVFCLGQSPVKSLTFKTIPVSKTKSPSSGFSLGGERCGTGIIHNNLMATDPLYKSRHEHAQKEVKKIISDWNSGVKAAPPVYTVPLVFHVIHKGEAVGSGTNISDAQIQSTVAALNRDFRRNSTDGGIALGGGPDTEIQFCLATKNPQGNPTTGINRVNGTSVTGYSNYGILGGVNETQVKALSKWPNTNYLNIWIVSEIDSNGADIANPNNWGGGTLAYAYLPGAGSSVDGIVVVNLCIGNDPQNTQGFRIWPLTLTNRTLTHEMGHVLGLYHTFDDSNSSSCLDGDGLADTPPAKYATQLYSCTNPTSQGACTNQNIAIYMDYTPEDCQDMFTNDQTAEMRGVLATTRNSLTTSSNTNCTICTSATITVSSTNPTCTTNNGSATANTSGGTTPFTYLWSNGGTAQTISNLAPGSYTVTVTTVGGCTSTQSVTLIAPGAPAATASSSNVSAGGICDGTATATATGGSTPYTYLWSNALTTSNITGLCAGTYMVTVTGSNSCSGTATVTISAPAAAGCDTLSNFDIAADTASLYSLPASSCGGSGWGYLAGHNCYDDRAKADYFTASNGDTVKSAIIYFGKAYAGSGTSSVNIRIWNGATGTPGAVLGTENVLISQLSTTQPVLVNFATPVVVTGNFFCGVEFAANGSPQDTIAMLTNQIGESSPGTAWEMWSDNSWHSFSDTTNWGIDLSHAIWVIKCTPGSVNCSGFIASTTSTNPSCTSNNGTATVSASGGTTPYTYSWSNSGSSASVTGLAAGTYSVTVTDASACTATGSVTLTAPAGPSVTAAGVNATNGCNGSATATATGGSTPYTYLWSNALTTSSISGLCAGTYMVTVTGSNSCSGTATVTVSAPAAAGCDTLSNFDIAADTASLYSLPASSCGGSGWGYLAGHNCYDDRAKADYFSASNGDTVKSAIIYFGKAYAGSGTSSVNIRIWNGATGTPGAVLGTENVLISQLSTTQPVLVNFATPVVVTGNFFCGVEFAANGSPQDTIAMLTNQIGESSPGTAWEMWSDNTWHSFSDTTNWGIDLSHAMWIIKCSSGGTNCSGFSATATSTNPSCGNNNGTATAASSGGTSPYTYLWSNGASALTITGLAAGSYSVTVTSSNSCTVTASVNLTASGAPTVTTSSTNASCGQSNGSATAIVTGGISPYTYLWSTNATTPSISGIAAGNYTVTVTDANTCSDTSSTIVSSAGIPTVSITSSNATCSQNNGTASATVTGGTSPYTYLWSNGATTASISGLAAGTYSMTVTGANNCTASQTVTITSTGNPPVLTVSNTPTGGCGSNNGSATVNATGGNPPYSYQWSNGGITATITGLAAGTFSVTVTGGSCSSSASTTVTIANSLTATVSTQNTNCPGTCTGQALVATSGGSTPYSYVWSLGGTTATKTGLCVGTFSVTITDNAGCNVVKQLSISASSSSMYVSSSSTNATCNGANGSATVNVTGGTSPFTYSWNTSPLQTTKTATGLTGGAYVGIATDSFGCNDTVNVTVINVGGVNANITSNPSICIGDSANLVATGGTVFLWSPGGQVTNSIKVSPSTTTIYSVTVTDSYQCSDSASAVVTVNSKPVTSVTAALDTVCKGQPVMLVASGGTTYIWNTPGINDTIYVSPDNTKTYFVTAQNGNCSGNTVSIKINVYTPAPNAVASSDVSTTYISQGGTVNFYSTGSTGISYGWDFTGNGSIDATTANATYNYTASGTFPVILSVTFPAFGNCTDYDTLFINVQNVPGTGIKPILDATDSIYLFPNPNDGKFTVRNEKNCDGMECSLTVYNVIGELIYHTGIKEKSEVIIDLSSHTQGIYYVNIYSNGKISTNKIILLK